jgi:putative flavoprotein involved in K+ transport
MTTQDEYVDTIVIGAGQAGLSAGYHLAKRDKEFVIVDAADDVGGSWATRWDSMRLFTPATHDGLPGMPYPGGYGFPTRDEMTQYLRRYAEHFRLPFRGGVHVDGLFKEGDLFRVTAGATSYLAANVIVATGYHRKPKTPVFAGELSTDIVQMHSADYRNPAQLREGTALLVGAGNSGADIALDLVGSHRVILAGRHPGHLPFRIDTWQARLTFPLIWFTWSRILTLRTPPGRKVSAKVVEGRHGDALIRVKPDDLDAAGVERAGRIESIVDGLPVTEDGKVLNVANVIWCTGFTPDYGWISIDGVDSSHRLDSDRGVVRGTEGLYVLGQAFQYMFNSHTTGGVGTDAEYVVNHLSRRTVRRQALPELAASGR